MSIIQAASTFFLQIAIKVFKTNAVATGLPDGSNSYENHIPKGQA